MRLFAILKYIVVCIRTFGYLGGVSFAWDYSRYHLFKTNELSISLRKTKQLNFNLFNCNGILQYRPKTSDVPLIYNIFIGEREYDVELDKERFETVLDLGANIGLFSIWAACKWGGKQIISVEAEAGNCDVCKINLSKIEPQPKVVQAGIWYRKGRLKVIENGGNWGFFVREADEAEKDVISAIDIDSLCEMFSTQDKQLLVKMDIEGSEREIFSHIDESEWLNHTYALIMEIHGNAEGFVTKQICDEMKNRGFSMSKKGENYVFVLNT